MAEFGSDNRSSASRPADSPDLVIVGPVTRDLATKDSNSDDYAPGGPITFGVAIAKKLDSKVAVVTTVAPDFDLSFLQADELVRIDSTKTTTFTNEYFADGRTQYCLARANQIDANDLPSNLLSSSAALLAPLADEVSPAIAESFTSSTIVAASPQGWMRDIQPSGLVSSKPWEPSPALLHALDVVFVSEEDVSGEVSRIGDALQSVPIVVLTKSARGCVVYDNRSVKTTETKVRSRQVAVEVDPTGAGDIFATAFLIEFLKHQNPVLAAEFASATASFFVEQNGLGSIPSRQQVEQYLDQG